MGVLGYCVSCNSVITLSTSKYFLASKPFKNFPVNNMTMVNPKQIKEGEQKKLQSQWQRNTFNKDYLYFCISLFSRMYFPLCWRFHRLHFFRSIWLFTGTEGIKVQQVPSDSDEPWKWFLNGGDRTLGNRWNQIANLARVCAAWSKMLPTIIDQRSHNEWHHCLSSW